MLARLHFVVRLPAGAASCRTSTRDELERRLVDATRSWDEDLADALRAELGEEEAARLAAAVRQGFPEAYKEDFPARVAVADLAPARGPGRRRGHATLGMNLYEPAGRAAGRAPVQALPARRRCRSPTSCRS